MTTNPVRLRARLDGEPSGGLWLVKWLLLIPHLIVLAFLWLAFTVLTVFAFFAILFTGRYPRSAFGFNLGVLRWSWRVMYYGYGALGTDRYPPFSLGPEPDYPATLDIDYPERLSRSLVLVKWWLLAIPHYFVVAFFVGGVHWPLFLGGFGLITVLALIAGVAMLFTQHYPRGIFDFVMGMNRWVYRVAAYALLMTDEYPPFRMDNGGDDQPDRGEPAEVLPAAPAPETHWTAGRVVALIATSILLLAGLGAAAGGGTLLWANSGLRDSSGYVTSNSQHFSTPGYALRFDAADVIQRQAGFTAASAWLGQIRVRVSRSDTRPLFVGIARTEDVTRYLSDVPHGRFNGPGGTIMPMVMFRPPTAPGEQGIWAASTSGTAPLQLIWDPQPGNWTLVVMNTDATPALGADLDFGATAPGLRPTAIWLLAGGIAVLAIGSALLVPITRRRTR